MIIVRNVFQARYGKGGELVDLFKEARDTWSVNYKPRILSDISGPFFTVVTEQEYNNLAEFEKKRSEIFSDPGFEDWFQRMTALVETGKREFFNVES